MDDLPEERLTLKTFAKINLGLHVQGKRSDGMHNIRSVMQLINLHDVLYFGFKPSSRILIACQHPLVPDRERSEENIIYRAAKIFGMQDGVEVFLKKNIPVGAGLGGGSSNAAGTAAMVACILQGCSPDQIRNWQKKAVALGADVPFFFGGGTQIARGLGGELEALPPMEDYWIVLLCPPVACSTGEIYQIWDALEQNHTAREVPFEKIKQACIEGTLLDVFPLLQNDLENAALRRYPSLVKWKEMLHDISGRPVLMSGSGSTFFTLYRNSKQAYSDHHKLKQCIQNYNGARSFLASFRSGPGWSVVSGREKSNEGRDTENFSG